MLGRGTYFQGGRFKTVEYLRGQYTHKSQKKHLRISNSKLGVSELGFEVG